MVAFAAVDPSTLEGQLPREAAGLVAGDRLPNTPPSIIAVSSSRALRARWAGGHLGTGGA
eukprot:5305349-Alexandrium_andersonii.AAC.1